VSNTEAQYKFCFGCEGTTVMFLCPATLLTGTEFNAAGVFFDGINGSDKLTTAAFSSTTSKQMTFVAWINPDNTASRYLFYVADVVGAGQKFQINFSGTGELTIQARNAATNVIFQATGSTVFGGSAGWVCVMLSIDLADSGKRHFYVGDVAETTTWTTYTDDLINFSTDDATYVGGHEGLSNRYNGGLSDLWVTADEYIDFSVEANRRKFYSASGEPASLGADGSTPTGSQPLVYLHRRIHATAASYANNKGSISGFTLTGTLTEPATYP
jgi:hypothetical protein